MTASVATPLFGPNLPTFSFPALPSLTLSDEERRLISYMEVEHQRCRGLMELTNAYYNGMQIITNLRIAIPAELEFIRTLVGWGKVPVDPYVERLSVDGFRLAGETDVDEDLGNLWVDNKMDAEQKLAFIDAFAMRQGWFTVGSPVEDGALPRICVQSPLNITAIWDPRTGRPLHGLEWYWENGRWHATFYASPDETVHIAQDDNRQWTIIDRDTHNFGLIPIVRMANEARSNNRDGSSEITPAMMSIIDQGCRTLLGMEVSREFYSVPKMLILGAAESDFLATDGTQKSAWQTYISRVLALERDENDNLPQVQQITAFDPAVFTKILEQLASQFSGMTGAPPQDLGIYTQGNPVSAEGWQASEGRRDRRARHKMKLFGDNIAETMQIATRFLNNGVLPDKYRRIEVQWDDPQQFNLTGVADATQKLVTAGVWSKSSDVTLKRTGLTAVERKQMTAANRADAETDPAPADAVVAPPLGVPAAVSG